MCGRCLCWRGRRPGGDCLRRRVGLSAGAGCVPGKGDGRLNGIRDCPAFSACYALGALGDQRAVPVLIGLLEDADLRGPARRALEVLTRQTFGDDPDKWKAWWKSKG